jgi:hypothetical protein
MPGHSENYYKYYLNQKDTELSEIFSETNENSLFTNNQIIYLAGFFDSDMYIDIEPVRCLQTDTFRQFKLRVSIPNRSRNLSSWFCNKLHKKMKKEKIELTNLSSFLLIRDLAPFLVKQAQIAEIFIDCGKEIGFDKYNWRNVDYYEKQPNTENRIKKQFEYCLEIRNMRIPFNRTGQIGVEILKKIYFNHYQNIYSMKYYLEDDKLPIFLLDNNNDQEIFKENQLLYLSGLLDINGEINIRNRKNEFAITLGIPIINYSFFKWLNSKLNKYKAISTIKYFMLDNQEAVYILMQTYPYLIFNKKRAEMVLDFFWKQNKMNLREKFEYLKEFRLAFPKNKYSYNKSLNIINKNIERLSNHENN